ncbi:src kinase-associated phosphoprotein 2-like isoform X1 [Littorina saxatilis]|uniref:Src kinase-associated phosphoprotein 2 n=1 Tax=Littorina saxatilis TaxID=31220 RepID=A0AAN9ATB7_9CAEN
MTSLKQKIGSLLTEVEKFLVETLKGAKLNSGAKDEKDRILEKVRQLLEEIPGSSSSNLDNSYASGGSLKGGDSGSASGSFGPSAGGDEEVTYSDDIAKIAVSDLKNKLQSGLLDKKKKSLATLKSWDHLYCVVSHNIFYMYRKQSDVKQKEAFCLSGYEFHEAPGLEKDAGKKEMCFELTKTGAPSYQFRASSKEGLAHWREAITKGIQLGPADEDDEGGETYEDVGHDSDSGGNFPPPPPKEEEFDDPEDIYEECGPDNIVETKPPPAPVSKPPATPVVKPPPKPSVAEDPEDLYDDATSTTDLEKTAGPPPLPPGNRRREVPQIPSSSEPAPSPPPKADLPPIPQSVPPPIPERRPSSADPPPPLPSNPPPLPGRGGAALRVPQLRKPFMDRDEDFENVYFGKWDCDADTSKELSFKEGEMVHVLSRDFDAERWWVGEVQGKIGLVPKDFLHPAFAFVA